MNWMKKCSFLLFIIIFAAIIASCGSSSNDTQTQDQQTATTTVTGSVFAASVSGASVEAKDGSGTVIAGPVNTNSGGSYSINIPTASLASDLRIESTSGSFVDEATGQNTTAGTLAAFISAGTLTASVHLDPSSTIVHALVTQYGKSLADANAAFLAAFGYTPDTSVAPKNAATDGTDDTAQRLAALHAGAFSQLTKDLALSPGKQFDLLAALAQDLNDGALDGKNGANVVSIGTSTTMPEDIGNKYENALMTFMASDANLTGLAADEIGTMPFSKVALMNDYRIEYIADTMGAVQGKTTFKLSITSRTTGSVVSGLTPTLTPVMHMSSHEHSTPVDKIVWNSTDNTYDCTLYYLMSSTMSGMSAGYWELEVEVPGGSVTFYPSVGMNMTISGDLLVKLKSQGGDVISGMSGTENRAYYIFNDGLSNVKMDGSNTFDLFIAPIDYTDMMAIATFPALASGVTETTTLYDENFATWDAYPVTVEACVSTNICTNPASWAAMTNSAGGHWSIDFASGSGIMSGMTNTLYVRLQVTKKNGVPEWKVNDTDEFQIIETTPGSGSM